MYKACCHYEGCRNTVFTIPSPRLLARQMEMLMFGYTEVQFVAVFMVWLQLWGALPHQ